MNILKKVRIAERTWLILEFDYDAMYYLEGDEHGLLIDSGVGAYDIRTVLDEIATKPVLHAITHGHLDHTGGSYIFPEVYASESAYRLFSNYTTEHRKTYIRELPTISDGYAHNLTADFLVPDDSKPVLLPIRTGSEIDLGGRVLKVYETPGHTNGCVSFYDAETSILFSGDAILSRLLFANDHVDRMERLRTWYDSTYPLVFNGPEIKSIYTGHFGKILPRFTNDLFALAEGVLSGEIPIITKNATAYAIAGHAMLRFGWSPYSDLYAVRQKVLKEDPS